MTNEPSDLVGLVEIAQRAGVQRPVVSTWRKRHPEFPAPVAELHIGPVFWWPTIKEWLQQTGRRWDADWTLEQVLVSKTGYRYSKVTTPTSANDTNPTTRTEHHRDGTRREDHQHRRQDHLR